MFLPRLDKSCPHAKDLRDSNRYLEFTSVHLLVSHFREELGETIENLKPTNEHENPLKGAVANFYLKTSFALNHVWDVVEASYHYFGELPSSFTELLYLKLKRLASGLFYLKFSDSKILKLYTTKIVEKISEVLREAKTAEDGLPRLRYLGFSGDDDTIGSFLYMLGKANPKCHFDTVLELENESAQYDKQTREALKQHSGGNFSVPEPSAALLRKLETFEADCQPIPAYSSNLIFEVVRFSGDNSLHVKLLDKLQYSTIVGESNMLPLDKFLELLESRGVLDNFDELCGNKHFKIVKAGSFTVTVLVLLLLIACVRAQVLKYKRLERHRANKSK